MAAHLPRFPLPLLLVSLAIHVPAAHGDLAQPQTTTYDANNCSNSMCGSVNIHYPFYMSRKCANSVGYYPCGYTGQEISCEDRGPTGTPVIHLGGHSYTVQNIFYERSAIILSDSDVLVPDKCPRVSHGVISFGEVGLRYNNSSDEALTFFFDCGAGLPDGYDMDRINCNGAKSPFGDGASFVLALDDHGKAQEQELAAYCKNLSEPVRSEVLLKVMASNSASFRSSGYGDVLKQRFELLWLPPAEECHPWEQFGGGKCSYGQDGRFLVSLCSDGTAGCLNCTGHGASTAPRSDHGVNEGEPAIEQYCEQGNEDQFHDPEPEGQDFPEGYEDDVDPSEEPQYQYPEQQPSEHFEQQQEQYEEVPADTREFVQRYQDYEDF